MELFRRKFRYVNSYWWTSKGIDLSADLITKLFDIPEKIKTIWISLHDKSVSNRHIARVIKGNWGYPEVLVETEKGIYRFDDAGLDRILKPLVGKTVYLDCEYLE
ncbi:hypothetical protein LCGC14_0248650 [marine sediment metagenome]|uniref:Uncharacterized protein n=1 Tax=marine sediment metagenome TaxID=412755 RepID=A0A0F9X9N5_9ZZZZ